MGDVLAAVIGTPLVVMVGYWIWFSVAEGDCADVIRSLWSRAWEKLRPGWVSVVMAGLLVQLFMFTWLFSLPKLPRFISQGWYVGLWMLLPVAVACLHGLVFWYVRTTLWDKFAALLALPVLYTIYRMLSRPDTNTWEPVVLALGLIALWAGTLQRELVLKWSGSSRLKRVAKAVGVTMMAALFLSAAFMLRHVAFIILLNPTIALADILVTDWGELEPDKARDKKFSVCMLFALGFLNLWSGWDDVLTELAWLVRR